VGAIAVAPSDPSVIYVGMGEACIRGNVSHGDGVYRSTDAGKTWTKLTGGLPSGLLGRIGVAISRQDSNTLYTVIENANPTAGDVGAFTKKMADGFEMEMTVHEKLSDAVAQPARQDQRAWVRWQRGVEHPHGDAPLHRGEQGLRVQDLRAEIRQLGSFGERQMRYDLGVGDDPGIGGEHAVDVGPDLDLGRVDRRADE
jgi:hypothetical protein